MGQKDPVLPMKPSLAEAKQTQSEVVVFPNGHMPHIENKEELLATLKSFIKSC